MPGFEGLSGEYQAWERGTHTARIADRLPPLRPLRAGSKIAISCEKPRAFLIRAWGPAYSPPERLIDWICHYLGRLDLASDLEWWGYTYPGQPTYMATSRPDYCGSGLTIQRFVEPSDVRDRQMLDEDRVGSLYLPPDHLPIPERGVHQPALTGSSSGGGADG